MSAGRDEEPAPGRGEIAAALVALVVLALVYLKTLGLPSLWLDEAWEANYYAGYTPAPWYNRPILYMAGVKALVRLFGPGEFVLRSLPCLAAIGAVAATWRLARTSLGRVEGWLAAILLAFAPPMLAYGHQLKHYAFDALFAAALALAYRRYAGERTRRNLLGWSAVAIVSFGLSFSSVFVVAATAAIEFAAARRERARFGPFAAALAVCGAAFTALYLGFHAGGARDPLLASYFVEAYAPLRDPLGLPRWLALATLRVLQDQSGVRSGVAAALLAAAGVVAAGRTSGGRLGVAMMGGTLAVGMAASGLALYPFGIERLSLHLAPFVAFLFAAAAGALLREGPGRGVRALAVAALAYPVLVSPAISAARPYLTTGWRKEHVRGLVETLARERRSGDGILVNDDARPAFKFYWDRSGHGGDIADVVTEGRFTRDPGLHAAGVAEMAGRYPRFWGLFTHMPAREMATLRSLILERCREEKSFVEGDARLDLYRCGEGP